MVELEDDDWNRVLKPLVTEGEVCLDDLEFLTDSRRKTVERAFTEMEGKGGSSATLTAKRPGSRASWQNYTLR